MLSILLILLIELIQCTTNTYSVDASGLVGNTEWYQLQGIKVNLNSNKILIGTAITNNDGQYQIQKSFQSDTVPIFLLEACMSFNSKLCTQQSPTPNEIQETASSYTIKTSIKLMLVSATEDSELVLNRIHGQFLDSLTKSALQNVMASFDIYFTEKTTNQQINYEFDAKSNQMGVIDSNILLEKSSIYVLKLTAKLENYWNFYSKSSDDDTYLILPGNNFKLNYETKMIKGNIQQIVKGIVKSDQNLQLLEGVDIKIQLIVVSNKQLLQDISIKTDNQGQFQQTFDILLWNQITININIIKDQYLPQNIQIIQTYDCDDKKHIQYTQDNGIIVIGRKIFLNIKGTLIGAKNQPISNQKIQINLKEETKSENDQLPIIYEPYQQISDANGEWQITNIDIKSAESISITISYTNILKQQITQKYMYLTNKQPDQEYLIKTYIQELVQTTFKGDLKGKNIIVNTNEQLLLTCQSVDPQNKPIKDVTIQSTKSLFQAQIQFLAQADLPIKCELKNGKETLLKPFDKEFTVSAPSYNSQVEIEVQYQDATFELKGVVTDLTAYVSQIAGAQIELKDQDTLTKTQSITNGQYTIKLQREQFSTLKIQVTFSASGFIPITTPAVSVLIDVQNKVYELNEALDRNRIQIAIKDTLQDAQSHPFSKVQATLLKSDPTIKDSTYYGEKVQTDALGVLNAKFSCYENVDFIATFQIDIESYLPYSLPTPKSKCQNLDMGISKIFPKKQEILLDISGKVIDPLMKPKPNLKMTLLILPTPISLTSNQLETNARGEWSVLQIKLEAESKYTISVSYLDGVSEQTKIDFTYTTTLSPQQSLVYQDIYFKDLETITIHGNIPTVDGLIPVRIPLNVVCQCEGKDKHSPTQAKILTNIDKTYQVEIQCVAQANIPIQCTFSKGDTTLIKPFTQDVSTKAPSWSAEQNLQLEIIYFTIKLSGKVIDVDKIVESVAGTSLKLIVTPQNGNIHLRRIRPKLHYDIEPTVFSVITKNDGTYSFEFKVGQDDTQICDITAEQSDFIEFQNKGFFIVSAKQNENQNKNIELKRILISAELQSILESQAYQKPLVDAKIQIISSIPQMSIQSNYGVVVTDSEKGLFQVPFQCYKNIEYTVLLKVEVPTFVPAQIPSNKFICNSKNIQLQPILMSSDKIEVTAIFSGKIYDPYGKGKNGLNIQLSTFPETLKLNSVSLADGIWSINDPKIIPAQNYYAILQFTDTMGLIQQLKKEFLVTTNNQKIEFPQINYQDYVKAEIQGKINYLKGSFSGIVSFQLNCPQSLDQNGLISQKFNSDSLGTINFDFQVLAKFTETIACVLKPINYLKPIDQKVTFSSPLYATQLTYQGDLDVFQFKIIFTLLDSSLIIKNVKDASISLLFNQPPPFVKQPSVQSNADGNALIQVDLVKGVKYILHLKIIHPEFKEFESQPILIDEIKDSEMQEKIELIRKTVIQTLDSMVVDKMNKPVSIAKLSIVNLIPTLPTFKADPITVENNGSFEVKMSCYYLIEEHFNFKIQLPNYADQSSSEYQFKCLGDTQQLKPVQLTLSLPITIIFEGLVINPFGKPQTGLKMHFSTNPESEQQECSTSNNGVWSVNDKKILPDISYTATISFVNVLGLLQLEKKVVKTQESNQKIEFPQINYQDYVKAEIVGEIILAEGKIREAVKFKLSCPTFIGSKGKIEFEFESQNDGKFLVDFEVLATKDSEITCTLQPESILQPRSMQMTLKSPDFRAELQFKDEINVVKLSLGFIAVDTTKLQKTLSDVDILTKINPPLPLDDALNCRTNTSSSCQLQLRLIQGIKYELTIMTKSIYFADFLSAPIQLNSKEDSTSQYELDLERIEISQKVNYQILDKQKQPYEYPKIRLIQQEPIIYDKTQLNSEYKGNQQGIVEFPLFCYKSMTVKVKFMIIVFGYKEQETPEYTYNCNDTPFEDQKIIIDLILVGTTVTIRGQVINPKGLGAANQQLVITTNPNSQIKNTVSDTLGKFETELLLKMESQYEIIVTIQKREYKREFKSEKLISQIFDFGQVYSKELETVKLHGLIKSMKGFIGMNLDLQFRCEDQIEWIKTDYDGEYKYQFQLMAQFDEQYKCQLQTKGNEKFQAKSSELIIKPPKYNYEFNVEIMETNPFDERVEKYFSKVIISGTVVSDFNCKNQPLKPVEQATVELIKIKQGNIMVVIDKGRTNEQGKFIIPIYISKKQLQNMIEIKVLKQAFIPSMPLSVVPQTYYKEELPIIIDLGYFPISPIAKNPDCPSS